MSDPWFCSKDVIGPETVHDLWCDKFNTRKSGGWEFKVNESSFAFLRPEKDKCFFAFLFLIFSILVFLCFCLFLFVFIWCLSSSWLDSYTGWQKSCESNAFVFWTVGGHVDDFTLFLHVWPFFSLFHGLFVFGEKSFQFILAAFILSGWFGAEPIFIIAFLVLFLTLNCQEIGKFWLLFEPSARNFIKIRQLWFLLPFS